MLNQTTENAVFSSRMSYPAMRPDCLDLQLLGGPSESRYSAEEFIQDVFFKAYAAQVMSFYPLLLSITRQDRSFAAVAGVRPASVEELFLEHYLDKPVEEVLSVPREKIVEIGNLAPADSGQARWLITTLSAFMISAGFTHVVFTAVPKLRNAFQRMGLPLSELVEATSDHLSEEERQHWGNYYDEKPVVFVGDLRVGQQPLSEVAKTDRSLDDLCQRASCAGQLYREQLEQALFV